MQTESVIDINLKTESLISRPYNFIGNKWCNMYIRFILILYLTFYSLHIYKAFQDDKNNSEKCWPTYRLF
jgi:hypothetical protein